MSDIALNLISRNKIFHTWENDAARLDLGKTNLSKLPDAVFKCIWLEELSISNHYLDWKTNVWIESTNNSLDNLIIEIPKDIIKLYNLKILQINGDFRNRWKITDIQFLDYLKNLKFLNVSYNQISHIKSLNNLTSLKHLNLSNNQISNIKFLENLTQLETLNLSNNQILDIEPLKNIISLKHLNLSGNQISDIKFLENFTQLETLNLSNNQIIDIGSLKNFISLKYLNLNNNQISSIESLQKLTLLKSLKISNNKINDIFFLENIKELKLVIINNNNIKEIPLTFIENTKLSLEIETQHSWGIDTIYLANNPIENPPLDVIKQGRHFTIAYLKNKEKHPLNECKVILVGRGAVGKTSLQKRLTNQPFNPKESETHGIRKECWEDGVKASENKAIKVHFWDFGGQHIQQALHQFFYSKNTIYILVLDKRKEENPEDFLELVRSYGHNSPVIIVYNYHIDLKIDLNISYDLAPELDSTLRSKYPNIRQIFGVCCGRDNDVGVSLLKNYLQGFIPSLDHVREPYPSNWLAIKDELLNQVQKNYLIYDEYQTICQRRQVTEKTIQKGLAEMLDTVGTITFFDRPFREKYYILNPDWLTTGAYQIILSNRTKEKKGRINASDLEIIFSEKLLFEYKPGDYQFLLDVMAEFDLCHEFNKNEWLIPSSLEGQSKTDLVVFKSQDYRLYCLKYTTSLPSSVIHRFIARNVKHAYEEDYWRNGIVVKHPDSDTLMFVEADAKDKEIRLWIKGERIRDCWEFFHKDFKDFSDKFAYEQLVMLPQGDSVSYQFLIEAWESGEESVFISKKTGRINVVETLGLFRIPFPSPTPTPTPSAILKKSPKVLLTFADNGLPEVKTEANEIYVIVNKNPIVEAQKIESVTVQIIAEAMLNYGSELLMFHFGGHSKQSHIHLEGAQQLGKIDLARTLEPFNKPTLQLVFLNSCQSYGHVNTIASRGVKAIIATNEKINDVQAALFAKYFYQCFFEQESTLRISFDKAETWATKEATSIINRGLGLNGEVFTVKPKKTDSLRLFNLGELEENEHLSSPWTLFIHSNHSQILNWTVKDFVNDFHKLY